MGKYLILSKEKVELDWKQKLRKSVNLTLNPRHVYYNQSSVNCYIDCSTRTNEDINKNLIIDKSQYKNNLILNNFSFSGMSGYNGYYTNFNLSSSRAIGKTLGTQHWLIESLTNPGTSDTALLEPLIVRSDEFIGIGKTVTISIKGLPNKNDISILDGLGYVYLNNGLNTITFKNPSVIKYFVFHYNNSSMKNIEIEIFPEYPGGLVFDGVDDYGQLSIPTYFKTVYLDLRILSNIPSIIYDTRDNNLKGIYSIMYGDRTDGNIAYYGRLSESGKTYINGTLNTTKICSELLDKRHILTVTCKEDNITDQLRNIFGMNSAYQFYTKMVLYKFLGFKEEHNQEQINNVINEFNLLKNIEL